MYLTGGLGSQGRTEAFGDDYVLPSRRAYAETCASIGGILWYHRMFRREAEGRYLDVLERTLYNGYLSGVSEAGDTFFYQNPLESDGSVARSVYFDVACCPANLARLMAQLPGLVYAHRDRDLFVNLFVASEATPGEGPLRAQRGAARKSIDRGSQVAGSLSIPSAGLEISRRSGVTSMSRYDRSRSG
jgi:DUF1680 family protein